MSTNDELAFLITSMLPVTNMKVGQATLQRKLLSVIDAILPHCDLIAARGLRDRHGAALLTVIRQSSAAKLTAISRKWNPNRAESAKNATPDQLVGELSQLLRGEIQPAVKPSRSTPPPRTRPDRR